MNDILLINGPNLNLLGTREPDIYGTVTLKSIEEMVKKQTRKYGYSLVPFQSNCEGELLDFIQQNTNAAGLVINPGAYTHYSYAIRDCIAAVNMPALEVHLSNIHTREEFRKHSVIAPVCIGQISGLGAFGYLIAIDALVHYLTKEVTTE